MTAAQKLGFNDARILRRVIDANGGGLSLIDEPRAPVGRLIKAGLIQRKKHPHGGNQPWVHTDAGLAALAAQMTQRQKTPFGECPGCAGMGWHLPVTCGLDDEQADYIVCTVCGNPQNSPCP